MSGESFPHVYSMRASVMDLMRFEGRGFEGRGKAGAVQLRAQSCELRVKADDSFGAVLRTLVEALKCAGG